ncbi:MAG: phosphotransferase [Clostridiales bacterium]|nr:MAG: phosphotransferase [Clostridiales bacterium]
MGLPHFYLITGVMASGKSTVAEILAAGLTKAVHLRGDIFRRMIVSGRAEISVNPSDEAVRQLHLRYRLAAEAAKTYFDAGFTVVLQDNYYGAELTRILSLLEGYPVWVVVLCPNAAVVQKRERLRGKVGYTGITVERLYEAFLRETPKIGFWLDTSEQTPEQSAQEILKHFAPPDPGGA